jgi:hypothetical protein
MVLPFVNGLDCMQVLLEHNLHEVKGSNMVDLEVGGSLSQL